MDAAKTSRNNGSARSVLCCNIYTMARLFMVRERVGGVGRGFRRAGSEHFPIQALQPALVSPRGCTRRRDGACSPRCPGALRPYGSSVKQRTVPNAFGLRRPYPHRCRFYPVSAGLLLRVSRLCLEFAFDGLGGSIQQLATVILGLRGRLAPWKGWLAMSAWPSRSRCK